MALIFTDGKDLIAGGIIYKPKEGFVTVPDDIAKEENLTIVKKTIKEKSKDIITDGETS